MSLFRSLLILESNYEPLCFTNKNTSSKTLTLEYAKELVGSFEYSTNKSSWNRVLFSEIPSDYADVVYYRWSYTIPSNSKLFLRAYKKNEYIISTNLTTMIGQFKILADECYCSGDIRSLLNHDKCVSFKGLFYDSGILSAPELPYKELTPSCYLSMFYGSKIIIPPKLPATTLSLNCYMNMFSHCTNLVEMPDLPAEYLSSGCYDAMFSGCTNLTTVKDLNSTHLNEGCYNNMFNGCINLTTAPELPATTLADLCYNYMFSGCTSLVNAPALPATTLAQYCYKHMFNNCTSLVNTPELQATILAYRCYYGMFSGCSSIVNAPELPATTLATECYLHMFDNCTSLVNAPELPTMTLAALCYAYMFYNCTSLVNAPDLPATKLTKYCYNAMFNGCTSLTTAPELPAVELAIGCYEFMFYGCTNLITAPELPAINLTEECYQSMFGLCESLTTAPELPATTLTNYCYDHMFFLCSNLNYVKAMFMEAPISTLTNDWLLRVSSTGTFVKNAAATWDVRGAGGIPEGWNVITEVPPPPPPLNSYTVSLNDEWQLSSTVPNPDSSLYDGVYESFAHKGQNSTVDTMQIHILGYTTFQFYIRSYAESNYDYVSVGVLDNDSFTYNLYSNTSVVKVHTRGNQKSGTTLADYTLVTFDNLDGGEHTITIKYGKDSSTSSGDDRGYVLIPKNQ